MKVHKDQCRNYKILHFYSELGCLLLNFSAGRFLNFSANTLFVSNSVQINKKTICNGGTRNSYTILIPDANLDRKSIRDFFFKENNLNHSSTKLKLSMTNEKLTFSWNLDIKLTKSAAYKNEWVSDCCLTPTQQFFSFIMARTMIWWWWGRLCTRRHA